VLQSPWRGQVHSLQNFWKMWNSIVLLLHQTYAKCAEKLTRKQSYPIWTPIAAAEESLSIIQYYSKDKICCKLVTARSLGRTAADLLMILALVMQLHAKICKATNQGKVASHVEWCAVGWGL
jgi:hypothetical protein